MMGNDIFIYKNVQDENDLFFPKEKPADNSYAVVVQQEVSDLEVLKAKNERLKQNIINLKYKWTKLFAAKRYKSNKNKNHIRMHVAEQYELIIDIEQTLNIK